MFRISIACQNNFFEIVKALVQANANIDCQSDNGLTPLILGTL